MAWIKKLQDILKNKAEFKRFIKLLLTITGIILSILFMLYLIFVFNWGYSSKKGLNCGGTPVDVKDLKK